MKTHSLTSTSTHSNHFVRQCFCHRCSVVPSSATAFESNVTRMNEQVNAYLFCGSSNCKLLLQSFIENIISMTTSMLWFFFPFFFQCDAFSSAYIVELTFVSTFAVYNGTALATLHFVQWRPTFLCEWFIQSFTCFYIYKVETNLTTHEIYFRIRCHSI